MTFDTLPAVDERDAAGETAAIFDELRQATGMSFVNLIWRHLAALPGGLRATWSIVAPLYHNPLEAAAERLRGSFDAGGDLGLPVCLWDVSGLSRTDRAEITDIVRIYNRANSLNLLALLVAADVFRGKALVPAPSAGRSARRTPPSMVAIRKLPSLADLDSSVRDLVIALDRLGRIDHGPAVASLYRHLAHWPAFLAIAYVALVPLHRAAILQDRQTEWLGTGILIARDLARHAVGPSVDLDPDDLSNVLSAIDHFTGRMIGRMSVVGEVLARVVT